MFNWTKDKVIQLPTSTKSKVKHIHPNLAWRGAAHCSQIQPNYACTTLSLLAGLAGNGFMNSAPTMARHLLHTGNSPDTIKCHFNESNGIGLLQ